MNSESLNTSSPTVAQLHDARLKRWHQKGEALLTAENLRSWINAAGFVLFSPRPQILAPAPTFVEAVAGAPVSEPTLEQIGLARSLLARLIADGTAVPLNLMGAHGTPGDTPDFVASAAVFSYIFTLRGDKVWKQPPATSGSLKVSNLALATYEAISSKGPMSAYNLATQLGKEVTEAACVRALNELWMQLRVIPLLSADAGATAWELTSARFTKQIKAGANAGIPSAVSALISLYLGQAIVASEDDIESFLSPLAPRSRIRDVAHTLLNARQLDTFVLDGKTLLHVAGEAPSFGARETQPEEIEQHAPEVAPENEAAEGAPRITRYVPRPRKIGTGYLAKGKPAAGKRSFERGRPQGSKPRPSGPGERERRPFQKSSADGPQRRFDKPWEEGRQTRKAGESGQSRPPQRPRPETGRQDSQRRGFEDGRRPPRSDARRSEQRPRPQGGYSGRRGSYPESASDRRSGSANFQKRKQREVQDSTKGSREEGAAPSRPAFRRFDAPRQDGRPQRPRRENDRDQGSDRNTGFGPRPPRRESGFQARPSRREGGFGPRPAGKQGTDRPFGRSKSGGSGRPSGKFAKPSGKKKPFQKKPSDRTFKPRRDESA